MRILFCSHVFAPSVGGIETVSQLLAREFVRLGHEVRLLTQTVGPAADGYPFPIYRRPSAYRELQLTRWCEVVFHNNVSLPRAWPLMLVRRPWVVAHHVWIPRRGLAGRLKHRALRHATGISVSAAVARHLATPSTIVPNPYDEQTFRLLGGPPRDGDLIFVGRLVRDKGVDLLLDAMAILAADGVRPGLTIVGDGPEEAVLRARAGELNLDGQVRFAGRAQGHALAELLNQHRVMVVPSRWEEPFGLVALEGAACGCVPVGSAAGGLAEAIGPCGVVFPNGDASALAGAIRDLRENPERLAALRAAAPDHLRRHTRAAVAQAYLDVIDDARHA